MTDRPVAAAGRETLLPPGVEDAFDTAITRVADREWKRLSKGETPKDALDRVAKALESLQSLQSRDSMPAYDDEWVALFYLLWYQPRQVYVAYLLLAEMLTERADESQSLRVIDLGCGALATAFGLTMAIVARREENLPVPAEVSVSAIRSQCPDAQSWRDALGGVLGGPGRTARSDGP